MDKNDPIFVSIKITGTSDTVKIFVLELPPTILKIDTSIDWLFRNYKIFFKISFRKMGKRSKICDFNNVEKFCLTKETSRGAVFKFIVKWTEKAGNANALYDRLIIELRDDIDERLRKFRFDTQINIRVK